MAKPLTHNLVWVLVLTVLAIAEATPPGIANNPSHARCLIKKYKHCYNLEHVCPKFCPDSCTVECVSCKPICSNGSSGSLPPPEEANSPPEASPPDDGKGDDKGKGAGDGKGDDNGKGSEKGDNNGKGDDNGKGTPRAPTPSPSHPASQPPPPKASPPDDGKGDDKGKGAGDGKGDDNGKGGEKGDDKGKGNEDGNGKGDNNGKGNDDGNGTPRAPTPSSSHPASSPPPPEASPPDDGKVDDKGKGAGDRKGDDNGKGSEKGDNNGKGNDDGNGTPRAPTPSPSHPASPPPPTPPSSSPTPTTPYVPTPHNDSSEAAGARRKRCRNRNYPQCYGIQHVCPSSCPNTCEIDCVTCKPVCKCDMPGAVCQDPRFIGGDGITFYFHGKMDRDFCLVTDTNLHINAHFIGRRNENMKRDFTWVQSILVLFGEHQLYIGAHKTATWNDAVDRFSLGFDGQPIVLPPTQGSIWQPPNLPSATMRRDSDTNVNSVIIEVDGLFQISAKVVPITQQESDVHNYGITEDDCFAHLELGFKFFSLSDNVNGVLGQTYKSNYVSRVKMGVPMPVLGGEKEFAVSSLFGADCAVSQFQGGKLQFRGNGLELPNMKCGGGIDGKGIVCKR